MRLACLGIGAGLIFALLLTRYLHTLLYGVAPLDPATFVTIPLVLLLIATASVLIPAARASQIEPVNALRAE